MSGMQNMIGLIIEVSALTNILLNCAIITLLGLTGAGISTAVTMIMWNVAVLVYVQRRLGINSTVITKG